MNKYTFLIGLGFLSVIYAFQPSNLPGVSAPMGFFDPLGFSQDKDEITFKKIQENEIKHGRIAMLASLGLLVQEKFHPLINGEIGRSIYHWQIVNAQHPEILATIIGMISIFEILSIPKSYEIVGLDRIANLKDDYVPGKLAFNLIKDEEKFQNLKTKELNNGRLAMLAILMIVLQQYIEST